MLPPHTRTFSNLRLDVEHNEIYFSPDNNRQGQIYEPPSAKERQPFPLYGKIIKKTII